MSWWPFSRKSTIAELSPEVARIFDRVFRLLDDERAQNDALPEPFRRALDQNPPCDQIENAFGEFGRSLTNPIPVNGPVGELVYLSRLQTFDAMPIAFHRLGSQGDIDIFETVSEEGKHWDVLYLSLYYPRKSRAVPMGYRHATDPARRSLIRGTTFLIDDFPKGIWRATCECTGRLLGIPIADTWLKTFDARAGVARPTKHSVNLRQLRFSSQTRPHNQAMLQEKSREHDKLLGIFDETFELLKLNIEKAAGRIEFRLMEKFDCELTYIMLYVFKLLLFESALLDDPTKISNELTHTNLARLAGFDDVQFRSLVLEYTARFDAYRRLKLFTNTDRMLMNEGALAIGRHLAGSAESQVCALLTNVVAATIEPLRDRFASLGR
jgi:hypothetical protein